MIKGVKYLRHRGEPSNACSELATVLKAAIRFALKERSSLESENLEQILSLVAQREIFLEQLATLYERMEIQEIPPDRDILLQIKKSLEALSDETRINTSLLESLITHRTMLLQQTSLSAKASKAYSASIKA